MTRRALAVLLAGAATCSLLACGGESREDDVADALADGLRSDAAFADDISADEARCVGDELVATLGADAAAEIGPDPEADDPTLVLGRVDSDDVRAIGRAMDSCVSGLDSIVVDLVAEGVVAESDDALPVTSDEADCIGSSVADELPFDRLLAVGLDVERSSGIDDLPADDARALARAFTGCVDVRSILLDQVREDTDDDEVVDCLDDRVTDADIEELFVESFQGGTADAEDAFAPAIDACT